MALQLDLLGGQEAPEVRRGGEPLLLPVESVDEHPEQPRLEFDAEALRELADTIAERGVRQPISVRRHPVESGRWILNFGARRLRASRLAGRSEIPAYVDETADTYDQVIENEQREGLKPLELAIFIQRRLGAGDSRAEIARRLGKSGSWVTRAGALIDAPDWLMALYREGRCKGMLELYELRRLHEDHREEVERWACDLPSIGRADVERLKTALASGQDLDRASPEAPMKPIAPGGADRAGPVARAVVPAEGRGSTSGASEIDTPSLSARSGARAAEPVGSDPSQGLARCKDLAEAKRVAAEAVGTLKRAMAAMQAAPVGGQEALRDLRAELIEIAATDCARG